MQGEREKWARTRIVIIGSLFGLLFLAVTGQAFKLQIVQHEEMIKKAERQHQRIVPLTPVRGTIMDRNGNKLAVSLEMDSCYAEPRNIQDMDGTAAALAPFLGISKQELLRKLTGSKNFVWLARRLTPEQSLPIKNLKLRGIGFAPETRRYYPNMEAAAHVIGFTGLDPAGLEGVELKYDSVILGNTGYLVTERDALGRNVALKSSVIRNENPGKNLVLTLDMTIQHIAEKELAKAVTESKAKGGMALVMESDTGRVLALANYPTFNPNAFAQYGHAELRNRTVADSFEPGSTFKIFVIAAAVEEKLVGPNDMFNCENGVYKVANRVIHDDHPHPRLSVSEIIRYSSNIGSAKIGFKLGEERLNRYLRNFGFGERTGIDLPGEARGNVKKRSYSIDLATTSFGQGVSLSAVQLASAVSAIANGGVLMRPYLVERILDDSGNEVQKFEPRVVRRVISADTSRKVAKMMETVTAEGGTGTKAAIDGYRVAGKTGTAQKVDPLTRGYSASKRIGSFVGFVPADKPKLTIAVIIDEPQGVKYGGVVAAPAFHDIALNSLAYLKILPTGGAAGHATKPAKGAGGDQSPVSAPADETMAEEDAPDQPEGGGAVMPDFRGMSIRRVLQVMEKRNINIKLIGSGRVAEQNPPPGNTIRGTDEVWVRFVPSG